MMSMSVRLLIALPFILIGCAVLLFPAFSASRPVIWHVSPAGTDASDSGSVDKPFQTISYALNRVKPSTTIIVHAGTYSEYIKTKINGKSSQRIGLRAEGRVVLTGGNNDHLFDLVHDYYTISGFEFTGKDKLLWLQEADYNVIENNYFHDARGECVRIKYQSTKNTVRRNRIENCGREDFGGGGGGKNGEGVYIGTAPEQLDRNPSPETDQSHANVISNNWFITNGNECVDIKEGSEKNIIEFNDCTGQKDEESGGFSSRGNSNIFRYNKSYENLGAGIRFGGDEPTDGINNQAYGNELIDNRGWAIKVTRQPQGLICGNSITTTTGISNDPTIMNPPC